MSDFWPFLVKISDFKSGHLPTLVATSINWKVEK
nr:MAG TPA: hypothetical protein [Caudoviricetes sp.]